MSKAKWTATKQSPIDYSGAVGDKIVTIAIDNYRVTRVRMESTPQAAHCDKA